MKRIAFTKAIIVIVLLLSWGACTTSEILQSRLGTSVTPEALANMEYQIHSGDWIQLSNGTSESNQSGVWVDLDEIAMGDLNSDGVADAVVLLVSNFGGSAMFYELIAVVDRDGKPVQSASIMLGSNTPVTSIVVEDGQVILDVVTHAENDGQCCPSKQVVQTYSLEEDRFVIAA